MKHVMLCLSFIFIASCKTDTIKTGNEIASIDTAISKSAPEINPMVGPKLNTKPYELKLNLHQLDTFIYDLEIQMELNNGAHFVSPNAKRDFSGKFTVIMDDTSKFKLQGNLIETPLSKEEHDSHPFVNGLVNWVRVNTIYNQRLQVTAQEDFQVTGLIQFTIEPRCTLEKIPFIIKYEQGEMRFEIFRC